MPQPKEGQSKEEFIKENLNNEVLVSEFPSESQRESVLSQTFDNYKVEKKEIKKVEGTLEVSEKGIRAVMTKEIVDRDGEIVDIDGMDISNYLSNPVLIDSHAYYDSIISRVLGRIENVRKEKDQSGVGMLTGDLVFANTPNGQIAKSLVDGGFVKTLSIGFGVKEFNSKTARITKSELYETSLVAVPSNVQAQIMKSKSMSEVNTEVEEIDKILNNYNDIHPKIKEYRKFLLVDLSEKLNYKPIGDELIDLKAINDLLLKRLEVLESYEVENQPKKEVSKLIDWDYVRKSII